MVHLSPFPHVISALSSDAPLPMHSSRFVATILQADAALGWHDIRPIPMETLPPIEMHPNTHKGHVVEVTNCQSLFAIQARVRRRRNAEGKPEVMIHAGDLPHTSALHCVVARGRSGSFTAKTIIQNIATSAVEKYSRHSPVGRLLGR